MGEVNSGRILNQSDISNNSLYLNCFMEISKDGRTIKYLPCLD